MTPESFHEEVVSQRGWLRAEAFPWCIADPLHALESSEQSLRSYAKRKNGFIGSLAKALTLASKRAFTKPSRPATIIGVALTENHSRALLPIFHNWGPRHVLFDRTNFGWSPRVIWRTCLNVARLLPKRRLWKIMLRFPGLIPSAVYFYWWLQQLIEENQPQVIVVASNTNYVGKLASVLAQHHGVSLAYVPHAHVVGSHLSDGRGIDLALCGHQGEIRALEEVGLHPNAGAVVGHMFCTRGPIPAPKESHALFCTNGLLTKDEISAVAQDLLNRFQEVRIRPHPAEPKRRIRKLAHMHGIAMTNQNIYEDLLWADLVVCAYSTVAHTAAVFGRETSIVGPTPTGDPYGLHQDPPDLTVDSMPLHNKVRRARKLLSTLAANKKRTPELDRRTP